MPILKPYFNPNQIKPEFGDPEQIKILNHYIDIRNGVKPVEYLIDWDMWYNDEEDDLPYTVERCRILCPMCFYPHDLVVIVETGNAFEFDSEYCQHCDQEFIFNPDSEFQILVKQN